MERDPEDVGDCSERAVDLARRCRGGDLRAAQNELGARKAGQKLVQRQEHPAGRLQEPEAAKARGEMVNEGDPEEAKAQHARVAQLEAPPPQDEVAEH